MAAQGPLTSPVLSLVMHIACVEKPPDVIDCKVCAVGSARQLISFCLTAYIRRITSERLRNRQEAPRLHDLSTISDLMQRRFTWNNIPHMRVIFSELSR